MRYFTRELWLGANTPAQSRESRDQWTRNLDAYQARRHILNYRGIRRLTFDYPSDQPLFHHTGGPIGDWGYDELTAAGDAFLRHEILFSSGTTLLIEFQELKHHARLLRGSKAR